MCSGSENGQAEARSNQTKRQLSLRHSMREAMQGGASKKCRLPQCAQTPAHPWVTLATLEVGISGDQMAWQRIAMETPQRNVTPCCNSASVLCDPHGQFNYRCVKLDSDDQWTASPLHWRSVCTSSGVARVLGSGRLRSLAQAVFVDLEYPEHDGDDGPIAG